MNRVNQGAWCQISAHPDLLPWENAGNPFRLEPLDERYQLNSDGAVNVILPMTIGAMFGYVGVIGYHFKTHIALCRQARRAVTTALYKRYGAAWEGQAEIG